MLWVKLDRGVKIGGKHRDPKEPAFLVEDKLAVQIANSGKGRIVPPPEEEKPEKSKDENAKKSDEEEVTPPVKGKRGHRE